MYTSELKAGQTFSPPHKCIAINLIGKGYNINNELHSVASFMDHKTHKVITKAIEMHFLNLEKADALPIQKGNTRRAHLINWMKIISTDKKKERYMLAATSPVLELLNEKIEEIVRSPEEQRLFDSRMKLKSDIVGGFEAKFREGMQQGIEKGMQQGIEKGMLQGIEKGMQQGIEKGMLQGIEKGREEGIEKGLHAKAIETARNCIALKMPVATIAKITGLTEEEIERL